MEGLFGMSSLASHVFILTQADRQKADQACLLSEALQHWCASVQKLCWEFCRQQILDPAFAVP